MSGHIIIKIAVIQAVKLKTNFMIEYPRKVTSLSWPPIFQANTLRNDMEDSRLQSRFLAPVGQSMRFSDTLSQQVPLNASSFNIEDMFLSGQPNTSQDSGINTANTQEQGPRLDASGFNADDFPEVGLKHCDMLISLYSERL